MTQSMRKVNLKGKKAIKKNFKNSTIIKPSICAGPDDNFTNLFFRLLKLFPIFPLFHQGKIKFQSYLCWRCN